MNGSVIIVAPPGAGKSTLAPLLLKSLGCARVIEEWDGLLPLEAGDLALTSVSPSRVPEGVTVLSLEDAMARAGHKQQVESAFAKVFKRYAKAFKGLSNV